MTPLFPAQRAAEEFDQVLGGTATQAVADRYAELLDTVEVLRTQPEVTPRAEFVGDLRSRLMTAAETELVAAPSVVRHLPQTQTTRTTRSRRRLGTVAASLVIVGGTAGMAAAASGALPGESLYPIKRGVEQATAAVHFGDASKGRALLDQAATRLDEVRALQAQSDPDADLISSTIDSFNSAADEGSDKLFRSYQANGDTQDITDVRTFAAQQMTDIASMSSAKTSNDGVLVDAADTLADIDQQARVLCGGCAPTKPLSPPQALSAGAAAATIDNLLSRPVDQAQVDIKQAQVLEARRIARIKALGEAAEHSATAIPKLPNLSTSGKTTQVPTVPDKDGRVTSQITKDGGLVPVVTTGVAVKDLVSGVTTSVTTVTSKVLPKGTPLGDTLTGVTDTVDKTVDGLLPGE